MAGAVDKFDGMNLLERVGGLSRNGAQQERRKARAEVLAGHTHR